jgi:hypothetical protein
MAHTIYEYIQIKVTGERKKKRRIPRRSNNGKEYAAFVKRAAVV